MISLRRSIQTYRRVKQRATIYSFLIVLLLVLLFAEAFMHNFNLVYITLFFAFSLALTSGLFGAFNLARIEADFHYCARAFANTESYCFFKIHNKTRYDSVAIVLQTRYNSSVIERVSAYSSINISHRVKPTKRGVIDITPCKLTSLFPLSTVKFELPITQIAKGVAYPTPKGEDLDLYLQKNRANFGEEGDFDGIVRSENGASLSRTHWASVAKGESAVKKFENLHESEQLIFNFYACADDDESRLSQLTLWVLTCESRKREFVIQMPQDRLDSTKESIDEILRYLALY